MFFTFGCFRLGSSWGFYFVPGITITRVAFSSFFADEELPRVMSEEPSCEVDQEAPELPRV